MAETGRFVPRIAPFITQLGVVIARSLPSAAYGIISRCNLPASISAMTHASFLIGIDEIDRQHQHLIDLFDEGVAVLAESGNWPDVHFAFVRLREAMEIHFGYEESLLRMTNYPAVEDHAHQHRAIIRNLVSLEVGSIKAAPEIEMLLAARSAMIEHICDADRDYAGYLAAGATIEVKPVGLPDELEIDRGNMLHDDFPFGDGPLEVVPQ